MIKKVLISACLLGQVVRYDGKHKKFEHEVLQRWLHEDRIVPYCPEVGGGLPVPRARAEIVDGVGGRSIVNGKGGVFDVSGMDIALNFLKGAERALAIAASEAI